MQSQDKPDKESTKQGIRGTESSPETGGASEEHLEPIPEVPPRNSPMMRTFKKVGYSVWLIVMIVGGVLAFFTFIFLL